MATETRTTSGEWNARRLAALAGPVGIAASAVGILGSVVLASWVVGDWFTWTGSALSHLGHGERATAPLFNYGLVVAGLLGVAFSTRVWLAGTNAWHRLGAALYGFGTLNAALVGVFPVPHDLHGTVAIAFFALLTLGLFAHGSGDALAGRARRGILSTWLAVAHVSSWVLLEFVPFEGVAIPEMVGVLGLWIWTLDVYAGLSR